jgi:hypothetical protein
MGENDQFFQLESTFTNSSSKNVRLLTDRIRERIFSDGKGWTRLSLLLLHLD